MAEGRGCCGCCGFGYLTILLTSLFKLEALPHVRRQQRAPVLLSSEETYDRRWCQQTDDVIQPVPMHASIASASCCFIDWVKSWTTPRLLLVHVHLPTAHTHSSCETGNSGLCALCCCQTGLQATCTCSPKNYNTNQPLRRHCSFLNQTDRCDSFAIHCPVQVFGTKKRMSAVAVLDVSGVDDLFEMVLQLAVEGRLAWEAQH